MSFPFAKTVRGAIAFFVLCLEVAACQSVEKLQKLFGSALSCLRTCCCCDSGLGEALKTPKMPFWLSTVGTHSPPYYHFPAGRSRFFLLQLRDKQFDSLQFARLSACNFATHARTLSQRSRVNQSESERPQACEAKNLLQASPKNPQNQNTGKVGQK